MKQDSLKFLHEYCDFSDPDCVWILKGVSRNKDNPLNADMHRFMRRMIITKPEDIEECYDEIHLAACDPKTIYRIYISLNSRNAFKGAFKFQKKLVDVTEGLANGLEDALVMSKKLSSLWKTELEQKTCRGTKRILLDIDNFDSSQALELEEVRKYIGKRTKRHCFRPTHTGFAIVFDAFDTRELLELCDEKGLEADLQRDSMVYVERF